MQIFKLTDQYSVAPQIACEDIPAIVGAGYKTIICNRPDAEVPVSHQAKAIQAAAEAAGLTFHILPLTHQTLNMDNINRHMAYAQDESPVLAYCASGTRSTMAWALGRAKAGENIDDILRCAERAGYQLAGLRPSLEAIARQI